MSKIKVNCEWHSDYAWQCECEHKNIEAEGQLDLEDGDNLFCASCSKEYTFNRRNLELVKAED